MNVLFFINFRCVSKIQIIALFAIKSSFFITQQIIQFFILFHYVSKNLYPMAIPNNFYKSSSSNKNCSISSENSLQSIFKTIAISFLILSGKGRWPSKN